jgi:RNA polymerase sigma-70 factor (ECF subfamily)
MESAPLPPAADSLEATSLLVRRAQSGDDAAREALFARHLPALRRWAHARLPRRARALHETEDLVQVTLLRASLHLKQIVAERRGSFFAYLRQTLLNAIRDELRRAAVRPERAELDEDLASAAPSPLEAAVGRDVLDRYEAALASLPADLQEAVFMRVDLGMSYDEIAEALGKPSPDAARMAIGRALLKLADAMKELR